MTLTEFVLARIAEDEARARKALQRRRAESIAERSAFGVSYMVVGDALDPSRVLTECEAKLKIVELHEEIPWTKILGSLKSTACRTCQRVTKRAHYPCPTIAALALPYADHPDFNPEWRP